MPYNGLKPKSHNKYMLWAFYTCGTSLIPIIIRIVLLLCAGRQLVLQDFRVELFFLSIIFFVDAIKNYQAGSWMGNLTVFLLIVCSTMYSLVMAENLALLKVNLSSIANIGTVIFGVVSCGLDIGSLVVGNE